MFKNTYLLEIGTADWILLDQAPLSVPRSRAGCGVVRNPDSGLTEVKFQTFLLRIHFNKQISRLLLRVATIFKQLWLLWIS